MGNFKVYTTFSKSLLLLLKKYPKTQFSGPLTNWKFEPSPMAHTLWSKNTQNRSKTWLSMDLSWHAFISMLQVKTLYHTEKQGFGYPGFQKKFQMHPPKPAEAEPSFRKVSLPPAKLHMLFPAHFLFREFWPQIYSLWLALDRNLQSKILSSMKISRA